MKIQLLAFIAALVFFINVNVLGGPVNIKTAGKVATNFYYEQVAPTKGLAYSNIKILNAFTETRNGADIFHVFNFDSKGFVIVAAEDAVYPILGYSHNNYFSHTNMGCALEYWMNQYSDQIEYYRQQKALANADVSELWTRYQTDNPSTLSKPKGTKDISPFLASNWGQGKYYNTLCPEDPNGEDGHALVGCVATSMSMCLYYYRHPLQGIGSHGYFANNASSGYGNYGWQFVNFGNTTYDWEGMNNTLNGNNANLSVAELCYHAGVAVDMAYGPDASGSQTEYIPGALKTYFGYASSIVYASRQSYTQTAWENILMTNLNGKKPIVYSGSTLTGDGHAWNMDGYETTTQGVHFHCNWGWDGMGNGYYYVNDLSPSGQPPFTAYQGAVLNIAPTGTYPSSCGSTKDVPHRSGTITDGSGPMNYENNLDCMWLIHPSDSVKNIILNFNYFDTEENADYVTIYDGGTTNDPVIGTFSGTTLPSSVSTNGSKMLVRFTTNASNTSTGWEAYYVTANPEFCSSNTVLTAESGTISDGSGPVNYSNNATCKWRIEPPYGKDLTLHFTSFDLHGSDYINVYDWGSQTLLLSKYTGSTPPADVVAPSGSAFIEFKTDWIGTGSGFEATYSLGNVGVEETSPLQELKLWPNPAEDYLNISFDAREKTAVDISIMSVTGELLYSQKFDGKGEYHHKLDLSGFSDGIYVLRIHGESVNIVEKIVVN